MLRPTHVEIDLSCIAYNLQQIRKRVAPAMIMAVVKANAYGHGVIEVSKTAIENGVNYLAVALIEEGLELRETGFTGPILIFGGELEEQLDDILNYNLEVTLYSRSLAKSLSQLAEKKNKQVKVHIKVDTGMGRVGIQWHETAHFIEDLIQYNGLQIYGIYTHFATSDERDKTFTKLQLSRFNQVLQELTRGGINIPLKHAANSGAIIDLPGSYFNLVRPGIMMYGYYPSNETTESISIKPAMTFKSKVLYIKDVPTDTPISYGRTYSTPEKTKIATIPVGYADGYNRLLSNKGKVMINGNMYSIVGRVCMDLITVDVGNDDSIKVGDEVILFGHEGDINFSVYDICDLIHTIPYEVCCWISKRVPRIYKS